jgi:hypothetical protein
MFSFFIESFENCFFGVGMCSCFYQKVAPMGLFTGFLFFCVSRLYKSAEGVLFNSL